VTHVTHSPYMTRMTRARVTVIMRGRVTCVTSCFSWQGRAESEVCGETGATPFHPDEVRARIK